MLLAVLAANLLMNTARGKQALTARLGAAFGRAVEARNFRLSLWGWPRVEANSVTVAEDPRFGHEYLLRAEQVTASVRWQALVGGRLEFGSVSLKRPSLNLVRTPDGRWNVEEWFPRPPGAATASPRPAPSRRHRIDVDAGRINFKAGADKHPFALVEVSGSLEQDDDGAWRLDLEALPMRAGVVVQTPGVIRARGTLGALLASRRPSDLLLEWDEAALPDVLRLARGWDFGVRGDFAAELRARSVAPQENSGIPLERLSRWSLSGAMRLAALHRWDLPRRAGDPALNLRLEGDWWPQLSRVRLARGVIEAPASNIRVSGEVQWRASPELRVAQELGRRPGSSIRLTSSEISLGDLFAWYRAFRPDVSADVQLEGRCGLELELSGWPPRIERAVMASDGGRLLRANATHLAGFGRSVLRFAPGRAGPAHVQLQPTTIAFGPRGRPGTGTLRAEGRVALARNAPFELGLSGQTNRAQDLLAAGVALGLSSVTSWVERGWVAEGPVSLRLQWQGNFYPFAASPAGLVELRGATLRSASLADSVRLGSARLEFAGSQGSRRRRFAWNDVQAFGARWRGTAAQQVGQPWEILLDADRLDAAQLHRWLNPGAAGAGFLERLLPGRRPPASLGEAVPGFAASGQVRLGVLGVAPLALERLRARIAIHAGSAWKVELSDAAAGFYGGAVRGTFLAAGGGAPGSPGDAEGEQPRYLAQVKFDRLSLALLAARFPRLQQLFAGAAAGELELRARGVEEAVRDSITARGSLRVAGARFAGLDLAASLRAGARRAGASDFRAASGSFSLANRELQLSGVRLELLRGDVALVEGEGRVQISRDAGPQLGLRIFYQEGPRGSSRPASADHRPRRAFRITGPLAQPQIASAPPTTPPP